MTSAGRDLAVPCEFAREMARAIPGARYLQLSGNDHIPWVGDAQRIVNEVEEFLTGASGHGDVDGVLATVLFTDIVDSTRRAADLGDDRWRSLLSAHDTIVRDRVAGFRDREIKTMGDGFVVT